MMRDSHEEMDMGDFMHIREKYRKGLSIEELSKIHQFTVRIIAECVEDIEL